MVLRGAGLIGNVELAVVFNHKYIRISATFPTCAQFAGLIAKVIYVRSSDRPLRANQEMHGHKRLALVNKNICTS